MALQDNDVMARGAGWGVGLGLAVISMLTIGPAVWHGRVDNRWQTPHELLAAAESIDRFSKSLGPWQATGDEKPLSEEVIRELGVAGYIQRVYKHRVSGRVVALLLMVGQPGPLVRHPPDICYGNRANTLLGDRRTGPVAVDGGTHGAASSEFRVLDYRPQSQLQGPFSVAYGFSTGAEWGVPDWPRVTYGAAPMLYKVQIQVERARESSIGGDHPLEDFLREFVKSFAEYQQTRPGGKSDAPGLSERRSGTPPVILVAREIEI